MGARDDIDVAALARDYRAGASLVDVGGRHGCHPRTARRLLVAAGEPLRSRGEVARAKTARAAAERLNEYQRIGSPPPVIEGCLERPATGAVALTMAQRARAGKRVKGSKLVRAFCAGCGEAIRVSPAKDVCPERPYGWCQECDPFEAERRVDGARVHYRGDSGGGEGTV